MDASGWLRRLPISVAVAVAVALAGWVAFGAIADPSEAGHAHAGRYESGGVALSANLAARMMAGGPVPSYAANLPMSTSTMPGTLASDQDRSHVEVNLRNPTEAAKRFSRHDFVLGSRAGVGWPTSTRLCREHWRPGARRASISISTCPSSQKDPSAYWASSGGLPVPIPLVVGEGPAGPDGPARRHGPAEPRGPPMETVDRSRGPQGGERRG